MQTRGKKLYGYHFAGLPTIASRRTPKVSHVEIFAKNDGTEARQPYGHEKAAPTTVPAR